MRSRKKPQKIYRVKEKKAIKLVARVLGTRRIDYQKTFDWLRGDKTKNRPKGTLLRVDAYFPNAELVLEYHGKQHFKPSAFMDRRKGRAGQRRRYTELRKRLIPRHDLKLLEIAYNQSLTRKMVREKLLRLGYKV